MRGYPAPAQHGACPEGGTEMLHACLDDCVSVGSWTHMGRCTGQFLLVRICLLYVHVNERSQTLDVVYLNYSAQ